MWQIHNTCNPLTHSLPVTMYVDDYLHSKVSHVQDLHYDSWEIKKKKKSAYKCGVIFFSPKICQFLFETVSHPPNKLKHTQINIYRKHFHGVAPQMSVKDLQSADQNKGQYTRVPIPDLKSPLKHWHGWDQVKVWVLKGENSHSKMHLKAIFMANSKKS